MPKSGGFLVMDSELYKGMGMVIINAEGFDRDGTLNPAICGKGCLLEHVSRRVDDMMGIEPAVHMGMPCAG
jgi:hypothetical protein